MNRLCHLLPLDKEVLTASVRRQMLSLAGVASLAWLTSPSLHRPSRNFSPTTPAVYNSGSASLLTFDSQSILVLPSWESLPANSVSAPTSARASSTMTLTNILTIIMTWALALALPTG